MHTWSHSSTHFEIKFVGLFVLGFFGGISKCSHGVHSIHCRYGTLVQQDGIMHQINNPEVEVDVNEANYIIEQQKLQLKIITGKLNNAFKGEEVTWVKTGKGPCVECLLKTWASVCLCHGQLQWNVSVQSQLYCWNMSEYPLLLSVSYLSVTQWRCNRNSLTDCDKGSHVILWFIGRKTYYCALCWNTWHHWRQWMQLAYFIKKAISWRTNLSGHGSCNSAIIACIVPHTSLPLGSILYIIPCLWDSVTN